MNIENHIANTKNLLDEARDDLLDDNYGHALISLACAYSNIRELIEDAGQKKSNAKLSAHPAWEDV